MLQNYLHETPAIRGNLYRVLNHGKLAGTDKLIILPVDQGVEHGPDKSFSKNPAAYDPLYHVELAMDAGVNAYAAPLGMLEVAAAKYPGQIPMILKLNSSNSLKSSDVEPNQAFISSIDDAVRLGCVGVGITIYPGSDNCDAMFEITKDIINEARAAGLISVIWSYPRGSGIVDGTALDTICYAAHIAANLGAHIIKVKIPSASVVDETIKENYTSSGIDISKIDHRIKHVMKCAFNGRRIVLFSGGAMKSQKELHDEITGISFGGGTGSIIGRNLFQRPKEEAIELVNKIVSLYKK